MKILILILMVIAMQFASPPSTATAAKPLTMELSEKEAVTKTSQTAAKIKTAPRIETAQTEYQSPVIAREIPATYPVGWSYVETKLNYTPFLPFSSARYNSCRFFLVQPHRCRIDKICNPVLYNV